MIEKDAEKYLDFCHHVEGYGGFSPWLDEYDPFTETGFAFVHTGSEDNGQFGLGDLDFGFPSAEFSYKDILEKVKARLAECEKDMDPDNADEVTYVEELQELVRSIEDWLSESNESKQSEASGSVIDKQTILDWVEQLNSEQDLGLATTDASLGGKETQYEDDADDKQFDCIKFTSNVFPLTFVEVYSITPDSCSVHVYDGRTNKEVGKATLTDSSDLRTAVVASIKQIYDSVHNQRLVDKAMKLQESLNKGTSMKTESIDDLKDRSVSHGTLRSIDLIPEFLGVLKQYAKDRYDAYVKANPEVLDLEGMDDETLSWVVDELIDELNAVAPEGTYFGSHPGDGSDFGFWTMDESKKSEDASYRGEPLSKVKKAMDSAMKKAGFKFKRELGIGTRLFDKGGNVYGYHLQGQSGDPGYFDYVVVQVGEPGWGKVERDHFDSVEKAVAWLSAKANGGSAESKKSEDASVHELEFVDIDNVHNASDFDKLAYDAVLCCPSDLDVDTDSVEQGVLDNDLIIKVRGFNAASFDAAIDRISQKLAGTGIVFKVDDVIKNEDTYAKKSEGKDDKSCKGKDCKDGKQTENREKPQEGPGAGYTVTIKDMTISDEPKISKDGDKFIVEAPVEYEANAEGYDWGSAYIMNELVGTDEGTFPHNPFKGVLTMEVKDSPDIWGVMNDKFFDDVDNPTDEEKISVLKDRFYKGATFNDFEQNYGGGYSHSKFVSEDDVCMQADWDGFNDIEFGGAADGYASGTLTIDDRFVEDIEFASDYGYNRYKLVEAIQQFVKGRGLEMDWSEDTLYDYVAPYVTSDEITDDYVKEILSEMVDSGVEFTDADGNPADLQLESIQGESKKSEASGNIRYDVPISSTTYASELESLVSKLKTLGISVKPKIYAEEDSTNGYAEYKLFGANSSDSIVVIVSISENHYTRITAITNRGKLVMEGYGQTFDEALSALNLVEESKKSEASPDVATIEGLKSLLGRGIAVADNELRCKGVWKLNSKNPKQHQWTFVGDNGSISIKTDDDFKVIRIWGDLNKKSFDLDVSENKEEAKKSESLTLKQKELKDMVRYGKAEDITTLPDEEAKELRKKGIETVGVSRGTYGMNGALLRDKDGNLYAITARSTNLFYFV